jgi:hypothetical protein
MRAIRQPISFCNNPKIFSLHRGRSRTVLVQVIPTGSLYRIAWPDIGLSDHTNLTRAKAAALEWAQHRTVSEDRKSSAARRLKSLDNFWWSSSPVAQNDGAAA